MQAGSSPERLVRRYRTNGIYENLTKLRWRRTRFFYMSRAFMGEKLSGFLNNLLFLGFVAAVAAGGYWWYTHRMTSTSLEDVTVEEAPMMAEKIDVPPSRVLKPMVDHWILLVSGGNDLPSASGWTRLRGTLNRRAADSGERYASACRAGAILCTEVEKSTAQSNRSSRPAASVVGDSKAPESAASKADREKREAFFADAAEKRRRASADAAIARVRQLYHQVEVAEQAAR
jgi:hypothetical protein